MFEKNFINRGFCNKYAPPNIIRMIKYRRIRWTAMQHV
jgi:hypothetical protein